MNTPNFQRIFESIGTAYLILDPTPPSFTIVAVTDAYLSATLTTRKDLIGQNLFDAFPDNPEDKDATGVKNLSASLQRVLDRKLPDRMAIQKYDIPISRTEDKGFEVRYWSPINSPILDDAGNVLYIAHHVTDVTEHEQLILKYGGSENSYEDEENVDLSQIERLNKIMVARELRMVELKEQLAECKVKTESD